jgi:hypothetical protein
MFWRKIKLAGKSCTVDVQGEGRERLLVRSTKKKKVPVEEVDGDDFKYFLLAGQSIPIELFIYRSFLS